MDTTVSQDLGLSCDYPQAFGNGSHTGLACPPLQGLQLVRTIVTDEDADAENAASGFLQIHEPPPLTSGDYLVIGHKSGFKSRRARDTERYDVRTYRWLPSVTAPNAVLSVEPVWNVATDWRPVDAEVASLGSYTNGYVQQFGPAIANSSVYIPGRFGRITRVNLATGVTIASIDPFAGTAFSGDARVTVNSAVSIAPDGTVLYTAVAWPLGAPNISLPPRGAWLVTVRPDDTSQIRDWNTIASPAVGIPGPTDLCEYPFGTGGTAPATGPDSLAPKFGCGVQRPAMNSPVAVAPNGSYVAYTYANNAQGAAFLIEIDPVTLSPIFASDTRGHLLHGCGVRLDDTFPGCAIVTAHETVNIGVAPDFNGPVRFRGSDLMDSAPAVMPDGSRSICGYDGGFQFGGSYDARGACEAFNADGTFRSKNEEYGWEVTATAWQHDGTFSTVQDRQLFEPELDLTIGQYSASGTLEQTHSAELDLVNANAIDYLESGMAVDSDGARYGVNADGHLFKWSPGTKLPVETIALTDDTGDTISMDGLAVYWARDAASRIYVSYAGRVYVVGGGGGDTARRVDHARVHARSSLWSTPGLKRAEAAATPLPTPPQSQVGSAPL